MELLSIGDVTDEAVTGPMSLGTCFGKEWYVKAPASNQFQNASSHYVVPAWHIPVIKGKETPSMSCKFIEKEFKFTFDPPNCEKARNAKMSIKIHYLELNPNAKGDVTLLRDNITAMIKTLKVQSVKKGSSTTVQAKWKPLIHLLQ